MESRRPGPSKTLRSHGAQSSRMMTYLEELADHVEVPRSGEASSSSGNRDVGLVSVYSHRGRADDGAKRTKTESLCLRFHTPSVDESTDSDLCSASTAVMPDAASQCDHV